MLMKSFFAAVFVAVVSLASGGASAHMLDGIPFAKIGSLSDVIEARFPRGGYLPPTNLQPTTPPLKSQLNPGALSNGDYSTVNLLKAADYWSYVTGSLALPTDVDVNGYPINGSTMMTTGGGAIARVNAVPAQAVRPGNYAFSLAGRGKTLFFDMNSNNSQSASCTGVTSGGNNLECDNSACTDVIGGIVGTTLTVTSASSCNLVVGQPITNASTIISEFGVPTIIIGKSGSANCPTCTGTGGTGTYFINFSQSIAPGSTLVPGIRSEVSVPALNDDTTTKSQWQLRILTTNATNPLMYGGFYHVDDEQIYASGQLIGTKFKERVQQAGFSSFRDLGLADPNVSNVSTWSTRKPTKYWSYSSGELRTSIFYPKAQVTYALNGSSNDYSINTGATQVDKQTVCVQFPTAPTNTTITLSTDNGTTKSRVLDYRGSPLGTNSGFPADGFNGFVFDAFTNAWISTTTQGSGGGASCLNNYMPPEAFLRIAAETGVVQYPWIILPMMAADPLTDYATQFALYTQANYPQFLLIAETPNELWNCGGAGTGAYASLKSAAYIAVSTAWANNNANHGWCGAAGGDYQNWGGKVASLLGQAIRAVSPTYMVTIGMQLVGDGYLPTWADMVLSTSYVNQSPSDIPIQSGCAGAASIQTSCPTPFTQTPAYQAMKSPTTSFGAAITVANYWATGDWLATTYDGTYAELPRAWCYYYQAGGCASQSALASASLATNNITVKTPTLQTNYTNWHTFANTCGGGSSCTPMVVLNYEGGFSYNGVATDIEVTSTSRSSSPPNTTFTFPNNPAGGAAGMLVKVTAASGGTWSSIVNNTYTIGSASGATFTIPLDSSGLGTLTSITFSYVNSNAYVTYFRNSLTVHPDVATLTTSLYNGMASPGGWCGAPRCSYAPSFLVLAQSITSAGPSAGETNLIVWTSDVYGYLPLAKCTACSVSGSNLTLGGTVTGIFTPGLALMGRGVNLQTITGACSQTGAGPAGTNVGDVCPLSASLSAVAGETMTGNVVPPLNGAGNSTTSPAKQWGATCTWNGNALQC